MLANDKFLICQHFIVNVNMNLMKYITLFFFVISFVC